MKLLTVLALLVLVSCRAEEHRYVNAPVTKLGGHGVATLWSSEKAFAQCNADFHRQFTAENLMSTRGNLPEPPSCADGTIGVLTHGTKLALVSHQPCDGDELKGVRVLDGKLEGKVGCIHPKTMAAGIMP